MDKPKILLISSASPLKGAGGVALDYYKAFQEDGYIIDFLTLYPVDGFPKIKFVLNKPSILHKYINKLKYFFSGLSKQNGDYNFFYTYEQIPEITSHKVLKTLDEHYDLILILFWQWMLSFSTIKSLYNKYKCQIHFMGVDYSQMTGGCHFPGNCKKYMVGCGCCPGIYSKHKKDFTYYNVRYREKVYNMVNPVVYGNLYMRKYFYDESYLLKGRRLEASADIYDVNVFCPQDNNRLRIKYNIPTHKDFLIFFGCQYLDERRKGIEYVIDSLDLFWNRLSESERSKVLLMVAGERFEKISGRINFDALELGYVSLDQMPELYSLASVYLSPSVNDAGPMMVNQALCCGTPVVAFHIGTALESVNKYSLGYCAQLKDPKDFAKGIETIYRLTDSDRITMSKNCREYAIKTFSYSARVKSVIDIYNKYNS